MMFDVLRFKADAAAPRVGAALVLTPARRVALVFPFGQRATIADPDILRGLAGRARAVHKQITIVGGDALLRACAVTAGLPAATSIEEWRGAARERAAVGAGAGARATHARSAALVALVEPGEARDDARDGDTSPLAWDLDAPEYLARLLPREASEREATAGERADETPSCGGLRTVPPPSDAAAFAAAHVASERDEEGISDTIRETSGLLFEPPLSEWLPPASRAAGDGDFGEAHRP